MVVRCEMFLAALHRTLQQLALTLKQKQSAGQSRLHQSADDQHPRQSTTSQQPRRRDTRIPLPLLFTLSTLCCDVHVECSAVISALSLAMEMQAAGDLTRRRLVLISTDFDSGSYARHFRAIKSQVEVCGSQTSHQGQVHAVSRITDREREWNSHSRSFACLSQQLRHTGVETEAVFLSPRTSVTSEVPTAQCRRRRRRTQLHSSPALCGRFCWYVCADAARGCAVLPSTARLPAGQQRRERGTTQPGPHHRHVRQAQVSTTCSSTPLVQHCTVAFLTHRLPSDVSLRRGAPAMWDGSIKLHGVTVPLRISPAALQLPTAHDLGVT